MSQTAIIGKPVAQVNADQAVPMKKSGDLAKMIEYMAKMLVDIPEEVGVNEVIGENTTVIELKVAKEDLGKIIGKQGRTARAIRIILNGASTKLRKRTVLEIIE